MAGNNRATQINKVLKIVKKHFKPFEIPADRTLLDHLIFACCAENSLYEVANEIFATLSSNYYDWNEVRVTSIRELTEVMKPLNDPKESATRLKRVLQSVFETHYSFDLELMKKQNIGQTAKQIEKYKGSTSYTVAFVTQNALGGHSIPINLGLLESMRVVSVISDSEASKGTVPGLERTVSKTKGVEIGSMLHQLGVELHRSPYGPVIRKLLLEIEPSCKDRLPKRPTKKVEPPKKAKPAEIKKPKENEAKAPPKKAPIKKAPAKAAPVKKKPAKKAAAKAAVKKPVKKKAAPKKKVAAKKKVMAKKKAVTKKKKAAPAKGKAKKKSVTKQLSKRKPK